MSITYELMFCLVIQLLTAGICIGVYKCTVSFMQQEISELKQDMKKYNNVLERLIHVEDSSKSAHHRIDSLEEHEKDYIKNEKFR
ncbi:MAG: hypothetical protein LUG16_01920 [Candidatus Gastranaerophilales bacterium]|nr:hypothetical protein [Candidatus Gastranaerophilales bacterium]